MQAQAFLERHSPRLLEIAGGPDDAIPARADLTEFLARVHADFETVADKPGTRESLPGEDVFWWAVTILEEFAEVPALDAAKDPYVAMMRDQLKNLAGRLAAGEPLPPGLEIHWFDDDREGG
ncbi:MAG: hypothetical protein F4Y57_03885 [Acidobacteria bacterium]|nr:hypothetical protein [Acidobacteriota bacterium]